MKKVILFTAAFVALLMLSASSLHAQDVKGKNFVNAGIGIGSFGFSGTGGLPITLSYERGITDKISGGLYLGSIQRKWYDDLKYKYKVIGLRASYHFNELLQLDVPNLDVYGGASIYYRGYVLKYDAGSELGGKQKLKSSAVGISLHAAARYMFTSNIGGFAELGYGISPIQFGAAFVF